MLAAAGVALFIQAMLQTSVPLLDYQKLLHWLLGTVCPPPNEPCNSGGIAHVCSGFLLTPLHLKLRFPLKKVGSKAKGQPAGGDSNAVAPAETVSEITWDQTQHAGQFTLIVTAKSFITQSKAVAKIQYVLNSLCGRCRKNLF